MTTKAASDKHLRRAYPHNSLRPGWPATRLPPARLPSLEREVQGRSGSGKLASWQADSFSIQTGEHQSVCCTIAALSSPGQDAAVGLEEFGPR